MATWTGFSAQRSPRGGDVSLCFLHRGWQLVYLSMKGKCRIWMGKEAFPDTEDYCKQKWVTEDSRVAS